MSARNLFGVVVRTFGLVMLLYSVGYLLRGILALAGLLQSKSNTGFSDLLIGVAAFLLGLFLMRGASRITKFAYPKADSSDDGR